MLNFIPTHVEKEISIALQTNKSLDQYHAMARIIESYGFDRITVYNDMLYQPAWYPLMKIAQATSTIKIGVSAVNPYTCHPVTIAGNIALLQEASHGRSYLGLARGAWLDYVGITTPKPVAALRDAFASIQHFLAGTVEPFQSEFFPIKGGDQLRWTVPKDKIPMLVGTWGIRTFESCYPFVDEIKLGGTSNPDVGKHFVALSQKLQSRFHKDEAVGVVAGAVTVIDLDGDKARELARKEVALYILVIAELDPTINLDIDVLSAIKKAAQDYNYAEAAEYVDDYLLSKFAFAGTPNEVAEQAKALISAGVSRIELGTPHGLTSEEGIRLLGEEVIPQLKGL